MCKDHALVTSDANKDIVHGTRGIYLQQGESIKLYPVPQHQRAVGGPLRAACPNPRTKVSVPPGVALLGGDGLARPRRGREETHRSREFEQLVVQSS